MSTTNFANSISMIGSLNNYQFSSFIYAEVYAFLGWPAIKTIVANVTFMRFFTVVGNFVHQFFVIFKAAALGKYIFTKFTFKRDFNFGASWLRKSSTSFFSVFTCMLSVNVPLKVAALGQTFVTVSTFVRFFTRMEPFMTYEAVAL